MVYKLQSDAHWSEGTKKTDITTVTTLTISQVDLHTYIGPTGYIAFKNLFFIPNGMSFHT